MLKVTFAQMGNSYIPLRTLLCELGLEPVIPPPTSQKTIETGTKLSPEFACFPLKVNIGNYLEAIAAGAEFILMAGGVGPCRFGYYGELQREILKDAGYDIEFLILEAPKTHPLELFQKIRRFLPRHQPHDLIRAGYMAWLKAEALDCFDRWANRIRPRETVIGETTRVQNCFYQALDQATLVRDIKKIRGEGLGQLQAIAVRPDRIPLKIMLVGEIFMVLEPRVNFQMERLLGENGVAVERTIYFSDWVYEQLFLSIVKPDWRRKYHLAAQPYLENFIGGHGVETVAHTVSASVNGYHGVIELAPFTCMPEIVAMQALTTATQELPLAVLPLIIDEHSAATGIQTRVEAFVDLLERRRCLIQNQEKPQGNLPLVPEMTPRESLRRENEKEERICSSI